MPITKKDSSKAARGKTGRRSLPPLTVEDSSKEDSENSNLASKVKEDIKLLYPYYNRYYTKKVKDNPNLK